MKRLSLQLSSRSGASLPGAVAPAARPLGIDAKKPGNSAAKPARIAARAASTEASSTASSTIASSPVPRVRVFEKLASAVEIDAVVARFENLAGRVAMLSFLLAAGLEAAGGRPLFVSSAEAAAEAASASSSSSLFAAGLAVAAALAAAAGAAATVRSRPGTALLEPVVVSLTGAQRSLGAVSAPALPSLLSFFFAADILSSASAASSAVDAAAAAVDAAVDGAVDSAFGADFVAAVLGYGDDDVISSP